MFNVGVVHGNIVRSYIDTTLAGIVCMVYLGDIQNAIVCYFVIIVSCNIEF